MAMEIWNINLYYEDADKNQKVLETSTDRTNISFYDLVNLIEGVGFSGIDFLYYRKKYPRGRGHLVQIDNDTHVRKMISEHNKEKRVQLYVFRERANIDVAPSEPQHEDDRPITNLEEEDFREGAVQPRTRKSQSNCNLKLNNYFASVYNYSLEVQTIFCSLLSWLGYLIRLFFYLSL
jgi:hypothetical protein